MNNALYTLKIVALGSFSLGSYLRLELGRKGMPIIHGSMFVLGYYPEYTYSLLRLIYFYRVQFVEHIVECYREIVLEHFT